MSYKKVTIALILKIWLGFDSKALKLDCDIKIFILGLYQFGHLHLDCQPRFENWWKLVRNTVLILARI